MIYVRTKTEVTFAIQGSAVEFPTLEGATQALILRTIREGMSFSGPSRGLADWIKGEGEAALASVLIAQAKKLENIFSAYRLAKAAAARGMDIPKEESND